MFKRPSNGLVPSARAVYCTQNKYTFISIHRYAKEVSGYEVMHWFSLFRRNTTSPFTVRATILSADAESREEQNSASHFLIGAMTAKLWLPF